MKTTARTESTGSPSPASAGLFRALFEQAAVGIAEIETATGCLLRVNRHYAEIAGHSPAEMERLDFETFIHPDDLAAYQNNARRLAAGEIREFALEMRCRRKDSKFVWVSLTVSALWAPGEPPRSHVAVAEDITNRKRIAAEVQHRGQQLQLLSQAAQLINTCLEVPVILRRLVAAAMELTGAEGGVAGLLIEGQMVFAEYNRLGQLQPVDYRFAPGYGVPSWVMETRVPYISADAEHDPHVVPEIQRALGFRTLADVPILSRAGEMLGCFEIHNKPNHEEFTAQDVELLQGLAASAAVALENARLLAERKLAEESQSESEETFRKLYEDSPDPILLIQGSRFVRCNSATLRFLGTTDEHRFLGSDPMDISPERQPDGRLSAEAAPEYIAKAQAEGFCRFEWLCKTYANVPFLLEVTLVPVMIKGERLLHTTWRDITERRQAVESLREGEIRLRAIIENAPFGAHSYELHTGERLVLTAANRSADRILGIEHSPLLGRSIEEAFPGLCGTAIPDAYRRLATTEGNFEDEQVAYDQGTIQGAFAIHAFHTGPNRMTVFFRDITESKRAKEKLAKSEERYRGLLTNLGAGVVVHSPDTVIVSHNSRATELLGLTDEQMRGRKAFDPKWQFINSDGTPCRIEEYPVNRIVRERRAVKDLVFGIERPATNDVVWVSVNGVPVLDGKGEIFEIVVSFIDITERKRAEDALRMSKDLLLETERIGNVGGWTFNIDTMALAWTDEVYHIHEIDIGPNPSVDAGINYYTEESRPIIEEAVQRAIEHGVEFDLELEINTAKGNRRAVHTIGKADLKNRRVYGFFQDITERKRAEGALRQSEARLSSLFRAVAVGIGIVAGRVMQEVNETACKMVGYSREELIGQPSRMVYASDEDFAAAGRLYPLLSTQSVATAENRWRKKDGTIINVIINITPIEPQHPERGVTFVALDITERKRAEAERERLQSQLTQAQKMESVGRLAGGVAHDFNNMLQVILGNVSLALEDLPADSPVRESLEEVSKSAQRSADLTRQLLAFARKQTIQPKLLDLNDTVAGMLKMLRRLIGEDINLSWMPGANLWSVKMDPSQIDQVLANLCVNSRDAIEGVGTVTIEITNVILDDAYVAAHPEAVAGDYVLLTVSDTGKGMDAETRAHLFEPFFTTKEVGKGTGLGLATVFGIVQQNHGLISVHSEPGRGATFKIHLPRNTDEAVVAEKPQRHRSLLGSETVLFVEDEKQILQLGKGILERHGYTVLAALTPEAALALALAHSEPISLLVTDVVMPGMNGKELREKLRSRQPELKCLFISGYTSDVIAHRGVLEHDVQFLQKPFTIEALAARVREVLEQPHDPPNRPSRTK